jgi:hypothetical protein
MAAAKQTHIAGASIRLSGLFTDPVLRKAFRRAEDENGQAFAVPAPSPDLLKGGAAEEPREIGEHAR